MHPDGNLTLDRAQTQSAALPIDPSTPVTWLAARTAAISTHQEGQRSSDNSRDLSVLSCSTALTSISPDGRAFSENFDDSFSTTTLDLSAYNYVDIFGHGFFSGKFGPSCNAISRAAEQAECTLHRLRLGLFNGQYFTCSQTPHKIFDIGTGFGTWARDVCQNYPSIEVIGTDIAPIQPEWIPPNCSFEMEDANQAWTQDISSFDLVNNQGCIGEIVNWERFCAEAYDRLRFGGRADISDVTDMIRELGDTLGRPFSGDVLRGVMVATGFEHIEVAQHTIKVEDYFDLIWYRLHSALLILQNFRHASPEDVVTEMRHLRARLYSESAGVRTE
ncbi:hypothetical protein MRS44_007050 [Fusarium solani]|uniref:uncharacterized protein n=1 Tax=Fusarium solani TaxID=169388 RepID=UPI0032C48244|nr:hypothetical protein MRS44_007050 [Fusarium solani]